MKKNEYKCMYCGKAIPVSGFCLKCNNKLLLIELHGEKINAIRDKCNVNNS
jgi:DNA-directed RNA polymerase subunit RPC12/RpoP